MPIKALGKKLATFVHHKRIDSPLINPHKLGHKSLEMKDNFRAHSNAMFVEGSPLDYFRLHSIVEFR